MKLKFGDELRNVMIKEGLYQREMTHKIGIKEQNLHEYLNNKRNPSISKAEDMLNAIGYELVIQERGGRL